MTVKHDITAHIIAEYLPGTPVEELDSSYDLLENGVISSLELLRLIAWLSDRYDIPFADLEISPDDFRSVGAIEKVVTRFEGLPAAE
ncbi:acyl carrier protein [Streptantibioticus silvisoli]|jgi:acyl carrier protein|uniref:Acyl carrier protein n=1 Tax=Streptantibioticus silvisoli TaxID=2705255 RepID=A0ABT6W1H0_9ACTN|nr:acyl carrier protein [Streptantibioticus silvisoli]MDI5964586.1 acyl carrier protein [Streptantibioticus silvisoli]